MDDTGKKVYEMRYPWQAEQRMHVMIEKQVMIRYLGTDWEEYEMKMRYIDL